MAEKRTITVNVNTEDGVKQLNRLESTFEDVYGEVLPLTGAIGELEDQLYQMSQNGERNTKEFADLAKEIARMKKVVIDTDAAVDGLAEGVGVHLGGAIQGVAGGFALAQGAMGAFGANSEKVEEALLKVQSAMAIADGIQSVREGVKAFKALKVAAMSNIVVQKFLNVVMSLNPIGLIIAGVVALGAAIYALWEPIKQLLQFFGILEDDAIDVAAAQKKITQEYEAQLKAMKALRKQRDADHAHEMKQLDRRHKRIIEQMEEEGAGHKEITEEMRRQTEERFKAEQEGLEQKQKDRKEEFNLNRDTLRREQKLYREAKRQGEDDRARELKDSINKKKEENEGLLFEIRNHYKDVENLKEDHVDNLDDIDDRAAEKEKQRQKEASDRYKAYLDNRLAARRQIEDLELDLMQEGRDKELETLNTSLDRQIEDVKAAEDKTQEEKQKLIDLYNQQREQKQKEINDKYVKAEKDKEIKAANERKAIREAQAQEEENFYEEYRQSVTDRDQLEIEAVQEKYFRLIELAKQYGLDTKELEQRQIDEIQAIKDKADREDEERARQLQEQKLQITSDALGAINGLVQAFAKEDERSARRAFNINKGVGIAQAIISTAQGVINAYANPVDVASGVAFAKSAIIATTGAAQIATIAKTEFQGASGGGSSPSVTGVPSASAAAPTFNLVGDTGVNQLAQTLGQQGQQPIEAYVVAGNVTTAQSLERNKIDNASL